MGYKSNQEKMSLNTSGVPATATSASSATFLIGGEIYTQAEAGSFIDGNGAPFSVSNAFLNYSVNSGAGEKGLVLGASSGYSASAGEYHSTFIAPLASNVNMHLGLQVYHIPTDNPNFPQTATGFMANDMVIWGSTGIAFYPAGVGRVAFTNTSPYASKSGGGAWGTLSDSRLKTNITELNSALDKITALHPIHFEYINAGETLNPVGTRTGFLAQEFATVLPGHTFEFDPPLEADKATLGTGVKAKGIEADLIPYLVKAIQELKGQVDSLKSEFDAYKDAHP